MIYGCKLINLQEEFLLNLWHFFYDRVQFCTFVYRLNYCILLFLHLVYFANSHQSCSLKFCFFNSLSFLTQKCFLISGNNQVFSAIWKLLQWSFCLMVLWLFKSLLNFSFVLMLFHLLGFSSSFIILLVLFW